MFLQRRSAVTATHGIHTLAAFRAAVRPNQLRVIRSNSTVGLNWYAIFLGYPILGVWYWCTDQTIVQRVLGAKTERDAQLGPLFAGFLKILPMFLLVLPGVPLPSKAIIICSFVISAVSTNTTLISFTGRLRNSGRPKVSRDKRACGE
jgi:hypothetical protein